MKAKHPVRVNILNIKYRVSFDFSFLCLFDFSVLLLLSVACKLPLLGTASCVKSLAGFGECIHFPCLAKQLAATRRLHGRAGWQHVSGTPAAWQRGELGCMQLMLGAMPVPLCQACGLAPVDAGTCSKQQPACEHEIAHNLLQLSYLPLCMRAGTEELWQYL